MGSDNIIIREYLESLKEDGELDYLFPILLNIMGFNIVATPRESKGQPQYGKDIIAVGVDVDGIRKRFYFELKGYTDKDIDDSVLNKPDGIIDSLKASKYTPYKDSSIPGFNELPIKYVLVHNGILKSNTRATFNGFIEEIFPEGNFDRWDIYKLADLFNEYLFSEYLFTDEQSLRLFKKTLALLDAPQNQFDDFKKLVSLQIEKISTIKVNRAIKKFFATQNLLASVILHYSKENNNLEPAKQCITFLLLRTWAWILRNSLEEKNAIRNAFSKLISTHYEMLDLYFQKTIKIAKLENGLFAENGGPFEEVGYPLRSFEYLNYLIYYFDLQLHHPYFSEPVNVIESTEQRNVQKQILKEIIRNNDGCRRPVLDNHSIGILNVVLFFFENNDLSQDDFQFIHDYLQLTIENILIIITTRDRSPYLGSIEDYVKDVARGKANMKSKSQQSTILVTILIELTAILNFSDLYKLYYEGFKDKLNLQMAYPNTDEYDIEQLLFEKQFVKEFYVETNIELTSSFTEFSKTIAEKQVKDFNYRTDKTGFGFLRKLAHIYFRNEFFAEEWRKLLRS